MKKHGAKRILGIIGNTLLWVFVAFSVLLTILVFTSQSNGAGLPNVMGNCFVNILSDSMKPTFSKGDMIIVRTVSNQDAHSLPIDTVVTYSIDLNGDGVDEVNTHRIVDSYEENGYTMYVTKGDNNDAKDLPIQSNQILGVYEGKRIPAIGNVMNFLQTPTGFLCVIVIPLALFFLFELYNFIIAIIRVQGKKTISKADEERIRQEAVEEYLRRQAEENKDKKDN